MGICGRMRGKIIEFTLVCLFYGGVIVGAILVTSQLHQLRIWLIKEFDKVVQACDPGIIIIQRQFCEFGKRGLELRVENVPHPFAQTKLMSSWSKFRRLRQTQLNFSSSISIVAVVVVFFVVLAVCVLFEKYATIYVFFT